MFFFPGMSIPSYEVEIDDKGEATYTPQGNEHRMQGHREAWQQRDPEQSPPTQKQIALLQKLMLSSVFTDDEVSDADDWMYSDKATEAAMSKLIERALQRIQARDDRKKKSQERRERYQRLRQSNAA